MLYFHYVPHPSYVPSPGPLSVKIPAYPHNYASMYSTPHVSSNYTSHVIYPPVYHPYALSYPYPPSIPDTLSAPSICSFIFAATTGHNMDTQSLLSNPQAHVAYIALIV